MQKMNPVSCIRCPENKEHSGSDPNIHLQEVLPLPRLHVDLTLVDVVNVGKIW